MSEISERKRAVESVLAQDEGRTATQSSSSLLLTVSFLSHCKIKKQSYGSYNNLTTEMASQMFKANQQTLPEIIFKMASGGRKLANFVQFGRKIIGIGANYRYIRYSSS